MQKVFYYTHKKIYIQNLEEIFITLVVLNENYLLNICEQ